MKMKFIFLIVIILPYYGKSQTNYYKVQTNYYERVHTRNDILIYACQFISGSADGVNQAIMHHELGRGTSFWNYETSWKNKYKDFDKGDKRPAFFGATTFAVGLTDGFHLTRLIDRAFTFRIHRVCPGGKAIRKKHSKKGFDFCPG